MKENIKGIVEKMLSWVAFICKLGRMDRREVRSDVTEFDIFSLKGKF